MVATVSVFKRAVGFWQGGQAPRIVKCNQRGRHTAALSSCHLSYMERIGTEDSETLCGFDLLVLHKK